MIVIKRDGSIQNFDADKILNAIKRADVAVNGRLTIDTDVIKQKCISKIKDKRTVEEIQNVVEEFLMDVDKKVAKSFILYREKHKNIRNWVTQKENFIKTYKNSSNTANATIDDNSNVSSKNIGVLNAEIHKSDNILINRSMIERKLKELYPDFDNKSYTKDLEHHIIYKNDESGFAGAIAPYCCSITMYPFLLGGIKEIGGLSAKPKNLDSFCGMYVNLIFATAAQFAGAVATSEFLLYFDYFARKEWGNNYFEDPDKSISFNSLRKKTIRNQIHQYFQQVV